MTRTVWTLLSTFTLLSCGTSEPTRSYCEAVCDWAVACQGTERTVDAAALTSACLADTNAVDSSCAKAESGEIDPASKALLEPCVTAVDAKASASECEAFVGSIDEIKLGTPPAECATQGDDAVGTFEAARDATIETGDQLCQRLTDTFCARTEECVLGDFAGEIPQDAIDAVGGTPFELCVARLDPAFTSDCKASALYLEETDLTDANAPRQSARECLPEFSTTTCDDLFAGQFNEFCAGAFSTPEQAAAVALAMYDLSQEFAAFVP